MDVIGAMKARRSVRSYLPRKVEQEKLNAVLEAVRLTPSRHNDQNIRVIVVRDSALKQQIRQQAETQPMVEEADVLLVFCATDRTDFVMPCGQYVLLCKQAAKNFHTICKKETALKRVLSNLLSAVSLLRFKAVFSCGFRVPPGSGLYQSCAAGSVCIPAGQKYCSPRPRKSCPADRKTPGLPSRCIGHRW